MASINLYLRPEMKDSSGNTPIYLVFQECGKKFKHYTGIKVDPEFWDAKNQLIKADEETTQTINKKIAFQRDFLRRLYFDHSSRRETIDLNLLKTEFKTQLDEALEEDIFYTNFQEFIGESRKEKKPGTVAIYESLLKDLKGFSKVSDEIISFDKLNGELLNGFVAYLAAELRNTNSTINKKIKTLKVFLKWASERGMVKETEFKGFKVQAKSGPKVFLSEDELSKFFNLNIARFPELSLARDLFLFGCFTGLRFSEIVNLHPEQIDNGKLKIFHANLNKEVQIPLNNYALMILKKYEDLRVNACFPHITNVRMNKEVKHLGKLAQIDSPLTWTVNRAHENEEKTLPKYALLSTNSARLTYAMMSIKDGMPPQLLVQILGQKNIDNLLQIALEKSRPRDVEIVNSWNKKVF